MTNVTSLSLTPSPSSTSNLPPEIIVGIVGGSIVGCIIIVSIIVYIVFFCCDCDCKRKSQLPQNENVELAHQSQSQSQSQYDKEWRSEPFFYNTKQDEMCSICHDLLKENIIITLCLHKYHTDCIETWKATCETCNVKFSCPQCNTLLINKKNE